MIKVTIISNYYYPDVASIANLYKQLAEYLSNDMEVTVVCAVPCYLGTIPKEYENGRYFTSNENGVRIIRIGVPNYDKSSKASRIKNLFYFIYRAILSSKIIGKQDVVIAVSQPPVFGGYIGYRLKKRTHAKLIYNVQDFNPEQMEYSGFSKNPLIIKALRAIDSFLCRKSDAVITVSEDMKRTLYKRLNNNNVPNNYVINNWVDTEAIQYIPKKKNPLIEKYGLREDDFLIVYAGNIGVMQNLKTFVLAARELKPYKNIKFIFIGSGAWHNSLVVMVEKYDLSNVILKPYEPIENIDQVYSLGDIEIVSIGRNVTKCSMPSKTWNILSCGVPVICQVDSDSELNSLINDSGVGYTIPPDDYKMLSKKIIELYESDDLRRNMGENARKLAVEQFDSIVSMDKYKKVIEDLAKK